jgi:hypothetical protein
MFCFYLFVFLHYIEGTGGHLHNVGIVLLEVGQPEGKTAPSGKTARAQVQMQMQMQVQAQVVPVMSTTYAALLGLCDRLGLWDCCYLTSCAAGGGGGGGGGGSSSGAAAVLLADDAVHPHQFVSIGHIIGIHRCCRSR